MDNDTTPEGIKAQQEYIAKLESENFGYDLLLGEAFIRGMRDIGYKSSSFALAEVVDNAIQADATHVDIIFGFDGGTMPTKIAVADNGHGMEPMMTRLSLIWGAGTRGANNSGFGKYGYGLPSASVSQCHRVSIFSKTDTGLWNKSYLDIDEIKDGSWTNGNRIQTPEPVLESPPDWVSDYLVEQGRAEAKHGTVVVWEVLDRVRPQQRAKLKGKLLTDMGVIYRNVLVNVSMTVDGETVEPCDPLFLTPGFRYYDIDEDRAVGLPPAVIEVKDKSTKEVVGKLRVRFARMPATFFRKPDAKWTNKPSSASMNERLEIADAHNGIIFTREGRQIDVVRPPRSFYSFNATTDRYWAVEVDFDASLDDEFSITTSKQQIVPSESLWDILKDKAGLFAAITAMRNEYKKEAKVIAEEADKERRKRASVEAIERAAKHRTTKAPKDTPQRQKEAKGNLEDEAKRRARRANLDPKVVQRELEAEQEGEPYKVQTEDMPGAPFFRCVQQGATRVLYLNIAHPFYTDLYMGTGTSPRLRASLEILLWALGEAEVDADPDTDRRRFYERERATVWSPYIEDSLAVLRTLTLVEAQEDDSPEEGMDESPPNTAEGDSSAA